MEESEFKSWDCPPACTLIEFRSSQLCGFSPNAVNSLGTGGQIRYRGVAKSWLAHD